MMEPSGEPSRPRSSRKRITPLKYRQSDRESDDPSTSKKPRKAAAKPKPKAKPKLTKTKSSVQSTSSSTTSKTARGKQPMKKTRTKVGKAKAFTSEELEAARETAEEREAHIVDLVSRLTEEQCRELLTSAAREQPAMVLEIMDRVAGGDDARGEEPPPPPPARPSPPWCRCGNCRVMQRPIEDRCCGHNPDECLSNAVEMRTLCLDPHVLVLNMQYRADVLAVRNIGQQDDQRAKNKSFRHAAYRQFTMWQHGRLRRGDRRVVMSCCAWKIRDTFPDPSGQYIPFQPGRL